jgi:HK97 family phage major capsid protein
MSTYQDLREKRQKRKAVCDGATAIITRAGSERRRLSPDEEAEFERRFAEGDRLEQDIRALEAKADLELSKAPRPDNRMAGREDTEPQTRTTIRKPRNLPTIAEMPDEQRDALNRWAIGGPTMLTDAEAREHMKPLGETRALSAVTSSAGAATIPQGFVYELEVALKFYGGIIQAADYIDTQMGNLLPYPQWSDITNEAEQLSENTQATVLTTGSTPAQPTFSVTSFNAYMLDSGILQIPIQLLQDSAFDMGPLLEEAMDTRVGRRLNNLATVGSGSNTLTGVVTAATLGWTTSSPTTVSYNDILELEHSVDIAYRQGPKVGWMMHDSTVKAIRKLTDSNGRPLFIAGGTAEGIVAKRPDLLNGYPIFVNNDVPTLTSSSKAILFGDFKRFKIRRVRNLQLMRLVERYADALQTAFIAFQRFDSNLLNAGGNPIRFLQTSAT